MSDTNLFKAVEVLILLVAGVAFVWWQLRDVRIAQERTRREREAREAEAKRRPSGPDAGDGGSK